MGGRGGSGDSFSATSTTTAGYGKSSQNGELKKVILYHGSFSDFDQFDRSKSQSRSNDAYGEGYYFTPDPEIARNYGNIIYKVEVSYSTDRRTAKRTGREQDFSYNQQTGYWVIPLNKSKNIRIIRKKKVE